MWEGSEFQTGPNSKEICQCDLHGKGVKAQVKEVLWWLLSCLSLVLSHVSRLLSSFYFFIRLRMRTANFSSLLTMYYILKQAIPGNEIVSLDGRTWFGVPWSYFLFYCTSNSYNLRRRTAKKTHPKTGYCIPPYLRIPMYDFSCSECFVDECLNNKMVA